MTAEITIGKYDGSSCFKEVLNEYDLSCRNMDSLNDPFESGDFLLIKGSISNENKDTLKQLKKLSKDGIHTILLLHTDLMKKIVNTKPFLICPYIDDLEKSYHAKIRNENDVMRICASIHDHTHGNVLTPYKDKMIFVCRDGRQFITSMPYESLDTAYSYESMTAVFLCTYKESEDYVRIFHESVCAYSVSAHTGKPAERKAIEDAYEMMKEKNIWMK